MNGIIKKVMAEKGFGFITPVDGNKDLFFHFSGCVDKVDGFNELQEGMEVSFDVQDGQKGPMAVNVQMIEAGNQFGEAANDADYGHARKAA